MTMAADTHASETPKKGKQWLAAKLRDQAEKGNRLWREPETTTFDFRRPFSQLSGDAARAKRAARNPTHADIVFGDPQDARDELHANEAIDLLSVRFRARDMKRRGKLVETWLRGSLLKRIILRRKPTREGISHDRYSLLMMFLIHRGLAEPDDRNGYRWCEAFAHIPKRAAWLIELVRKEGEMRHLAAPQRFVICE